MPPSGTEAWSRPGGRPQAGRCSPWRCRVARRSRGPVRKPVWFGSNGGRGGMAGRWGGGRWGSGFVGVGWHGVAMGDGACRVVSAEGGGAEGGVVRAFTLKLAPTVGQVSGVGRALGGQPAVY